MKILGIDPGYERLGIAIIEKNESKKETILFSNCVRTSGTDSFEKRLHVIGVSLEKIIQDYKPDCAAIEELYFAKNTKTAMTVAEARGVIRYVLESCKIPCTEYHPNTIKIAITGYGGADKNAIQSMLPQLISLNPEFTPNNDQKIPKKLDDELDAIAVALTHSAHVRTSYPQK